MDILLLLQMGQQLLYLRKTACARLPVGPVDTRCLKHGVNKNFVGQPALVGRVLHGRDPAYQVVLKNRNGGALPQYVLRIENCKGNAYHLT